MNFTNFNLINGFLILIFMITELSKLDDIDIKKDLIKIILQLSSLLYVYVYVTYQFLIHQFLKTLIWE